MKPMVNKKMKQSDPFEYYLIKKVGKTIKKYNLIEQGDRILVALSGGKDSLTLLKILHDRRSFYPNQYEIMALHVVSNLKCEGATDSSVLEDYLQENGFPAASCRCPVEREMKREMFKRMLREIEQANPRASINALRSLENIKDEYLPGRLVREDISI